MATVQSVGGIDQAKGPSGAQGELRIYQVPVKVTGTYATASKPSFDLLAELQAQKHMAVSAVNVKSVFLLRDYYDGTTRYTAPNAQIVLSGTGNKVATFRIDSTDSTHSNGDSNSEISDSTALAGVFVFGVVCSITAA